MGNTVWKYEEFAQTMFTIYSQNRKKVYIFWVWVTRLKMQFINWNNLNAFRGSAGILNPDEVKIFPDIYLANFKSILTNIKNLHGKFIIINGIKLPLKYGRDNVQCWQFKRTEFFNSLPGNKQK